MLPSRWSRRTVTGPTSSERASTWSPTSTKPAPSASTGVTSRTSSRTWPNSQALHACWQRRRPARLMSVELKLRAPYVGPSAFREGDVLYGRDAEALDLCDLLIASRIVLLSSPSGAGKTSLIQARIVPDMRKEGFRIHPLIRVGGAPQSLSGVDNQPANRYVNCTINCLEHDQPGATPDGNGRHLDVNLSRYLDLRSAEDDAESELFIFDQFEEILTADPTDQDAKREFFRQLGAVLRKPHRWALFAIREDYAASLEPYARRV